MSEAAPNSQRSGTVYSTPLDGGPTSAQDTVQCVHCAYTFIYGKSRANGIPGTGVKRGWCMKCHGILCGRPLCVARGCVHRDQFLENVDAFFAGKNVAWNHVPVVVSVPRAVS